jgi:hypothetical protein
VIPFISTAISGNAIIGRNYQFAFRQIYDNNQITVLSPFSEVVASGKYPENIDDPTAFNAISILYLVTRPDRTKEVEILARTPDTGEWFVVKTIKRSEFFGSGGFYQYTFTGTEQQVPVATADAIKQQEGIPRESIDLQIQKNKLFAIDSLTGFDYGDNDMTLSLTVMEKTAVERERYFKDGGLYNFGVRFFDEEMRTDGTVHKVTQVPIPETGAISFVPPNGGKLETRRQYLEVDLKGKPPVWAHYWTLVRSDELYYSQFIQCYAYVNYYRRPEVEGDPKTTDSSNYYMYGNKYGFRADISSYADYRYIHLQLPTNIPFAAERGMMVKYLTDTTVGQSTRVLDVQGPMIVVEQPTGLTGGKFTFDTVFVEIYIPKNVTETNSFYEVGGLRDVGNPGEEDRNFGTNLPYDVFGDVHSVLNDDEGLNWKYDFNEYITNGSDEDDQGIVKSKYTYGRFESYSPSFSPTQLTDVQGEQTVAFLLEFEYDFDFGYIIDQSYASRNLGRPAPLLQNVREETRPSTIRWSNDYVANASINGLHTFEPLNEYPLPLERGPIVKLQRAGEDVMLAIHSSAVTSLYIGKGVIRSADLNPTLVTTTDVVGSDNELKYSHGTVHPTSVCEVDGDVYFWDGIRNEPVRYSQNGLTPIATTFGARVFFKDTIRATFGNTDEYECYSQYDRLLNMVFFTFKSDTESMTIGFHESTKAWIGKYGFVPEYYGVIGDQFIGFYQGIPWLHNADDLNHNTFYGVLYPSKAHLVINNGGHIEKSWDGIMVDSNKIWELPAIYNNENQLTSLVANDFVWRDQVYYADFLRDENTDPLLLKSGQIALRHGKIMTSQILEVEMELNSSEPHYLHSIVVASTLKAGHMLQQQQ